MTRKELMENRILSKDVIETVKRNHYYSFVPDFRKGYDEEDLAEKRYISSEAIQRLQPEKVVDILLNEGGKYEVKNTNDIIRILSAATGRSDDELRTAIFGEGTFDEKKFYEPTEKQKEVLKAIMYITDKIGHKVNWNDYEHWPEDCKKKWEDVLDDIPAEAIPSEMHEIDGYLEYYINNGFPVWLSL